MSIQKSELQFISIQREMGFRPERRDCVRNTAKKNNGSIRRRRKRKQLLRRWIRIGTSVAFAALFAVVFQNLDLFMETSAENKKIEIEEMMAEEQYPQELQKLLEENEESYDFVENYANRKDYMGKPIDLSGDYQAGSVPLLMQWDKRWGYDLYGESMIGLAGCGPACMTMAYLYHTGDLTVNPREVAEFAQEKGYHTTEGTSWDFWTSGAKELGLYGEVVSLSETVMKSVLDSGGLLVCSMSAGDFTTGGHYILLRGYDENGFFVNDPNRRSNSERQWDFDTLASQMKNLWGIYSLSE